MIRVLKRLGAAGVIVFLLTLAAVIWQTGRMKADHLDGAGFNGKADAALILGAGLEPDFQLGFSARRRIRTGMHLLREGKVERLIVSDGSARWQGGSSAARMKAFAVTLGASPEQVIEDDIAETTFDSFRLLGPILETEGIGSIVIVTDAYHLARSRRLAAFFDAPVAGLAAAEGLFYERKATQAHALARETLAWWYNLYKIAVWSGLERLGWSEQDRLGVVR